MPNPILNAKTFKNESTYTSSDLEAGWAAPNAATTDAASTTRPVVMTINGAIVKTLLLFAILLVGAGWGWSQVDIISRPEALGGDYANMSSTTSVVLFVALFAALGLGIATAFAPKAARFTGPLYALAEGVVLGVVSALYEAQWNGIVLQAVAVTLGVMFVMLFAYTSRAIRVTPKLAKGIFIATAGVLVAYLGMFLASLFGLNVDVFQSGPIGIVVSAVIAGIAASNLLLDFALIEEGARNEAPRYYEWYCGFGLMVTLVWLYLSILRLIAVIQGNR